MITATFSLAVALALSTAMFAITNATTHAESPLRDVDHLLQLQVDINADYVPRAAELNAAIASLPGVSGVATARLEFQVPIGSGSNVDEANVAFARPGYFDVLGVSPRIGRALSAGEPLADQVAVASDRLWRRAFNNRAELGDAHVSVNGKQYAVIGVMPPGTDDPLGSPDVWLLDTAPDSGGIGAVYVRLQPQSTVASFQSSLSALFDRFDRLYAGPKRWGFRAYIGSMRSDPLEIRSVRRALFAAAFCLLAIGCANVAALALARGTGRRPNFAIQLAIGAAPRQIAMEVVAEVGTLTAAGGVAGVILAMWIVDTLARGIPEQVRWEGIVSPHWSVRVFALSAIAMLAVMGLASVFPAWRASKTPPAAALRDGAYGTTKATHMAFKWLVMAELALSLTLMIGASLALKSIRLMETFDFGFDPSPLVRGDVGLRFNLRDSLARADAVRILAQIRSAIASTPGVRSVSLLPPWVCDAEGSFIETDQSVSIRIDPGPNQATQCTAVGAGFFSTLGVEVIDGRDFMDGDDATGGAVILDTRTAHLLFRDGRAVGHLVKLGVTGSTRPWLSVIGVVREHALRFPKYPELLTSAPPVVYAFLPPPSDAGRWRRGGFVARTNASAAHMAVRIANAAYMVGRGHLNMHVEPWADGFNRQILQERYFARIVLVLGLAALALGCTGLYSVVTYVTAQRTREFAVRRALGASRARVIRSVLWDGIVMAIGGTAFGAGIGMWSAFLLWDKMWGVYPVDAGALVMAEATLLVAAVASCLVPAMGASRVSPADVMHSV